MMYVVITTEQHTIDYAEIKEVYATFTSTDAVYSFSDLQQRIAEYRDNGTQIIWR